MSIFSPLLYQIVFLAGMGRTAAGDASLIITLNPVFTALIAIPLLGSRMNRKLATGLLLGLGGVVVITGWSPNSDIPLSTRLTGDFLIMIGAACWATQTNLMKRMLEREPEAGQARFTPLSIVTWNSVIGCLMLLPVAAGEILLRGWVAPRLLDWQMLAFLAIIAQVVSYILWARGVDRLGATATATYVFLVPVFGVFFGWLLLDEQLGISLLLGFVLIILGVRLAQTASVENSAS
jgi:drug/metabolite transporter (DMT)-like permease